MKIGKFWCLTLLVDLLDGSLGVWVMSIGAEVPWELSDFRLYIGGAFDVGFFLAEYALELVMLVSSFFSCAVLLFTESARSLRVNLRCLV